MEILCSVGALYGEVGFAALAVPVLRPLGPKVLSATDCGITAAESVLLGVLLDGGTVLWMPTPGEATALLWQAAVVTAVGFVCWYMGTQRIDAERATLFSGPIPVSAALTAPLVGTGSYGIPQVCGSLLAGLGVVLGSGVLPRSGAARGVDSAAGIENDARHERRIVVHRNMSATGQPYQPGTRNGVLGPDSLATQQQPVVAAPGDGHGQPRHVIGERDTPPDGKRLAETGRLAQGDGLRDNGAG